MTVQQAFERCAVQADEQRRRVEKAVVLSHGLYGLAVLGTDQHMQGLAQQCLGCVAEQGAHVGADLDDIQLRF